MKLALCWRVSRKWAGLIRSLELVAWAITRAARGPGAERRAVDRSPARRDAGGGSASLSHAKQTVFRAKLISQTGQLSQIQYTLHRHFTGLTGDSGGPFFLRDFHGLW